VKSSSQHRRESVHQVSEKEESNLITSLHITPKKTCFEKKKIIMLDCSRQSQKAVWRGWPWAC